MNPDGLTAAKRGGRTTFFQGVRSVGSTCMLSFIMSWLAGLGLAVLITAVAAITGIKPKGTRHVIIFAYLAFRARSGG
jgi:hypothetical protein